MTLRDLSLVDRAVSWAKAAHHAWSTTSLQHRVELLRRFAQAVQLRSSAAARRISEETGKPLWESTQEVALVRAKVEHSIRAYHERRAEQSLEQGGVTTALRFRGHGVVAVIGPFNMPMHLPGGHIVPALLAGNTVVFKPSELTPGCGAMLADMWREADLPDGVLGLAQGGAEVGQELVKHPAVRGVFFTGSFGAGRAILRSCAEDPGKIVALEMGGNNALVAWPPFDVKRAARTVVQSAFLTSGQRCSCARRLIVPRDADALLRELASLTQRLRVGRYTHAPEPFMGPLVCPAAAQRVLDAWARLLAQGGKPIVELRRMDQGALLAPGVMEVVDERDEEIFGPLLCVERVEDFDAAVAAANRSRFGLSASLLCEDRALYERFVREVCAGVVNWNRPTTGASGALPFGGVGHSGNHRPSGYWAADYCSYPIASQESPRLTSDEPLPGLDA